MKVYATYADWKKDQSATNLELIEAIENLIDQIAPQFTKSVKWGQGCWLQADTPKLYIHAESDHIQLGFYRGVELEDPYHLLNGKGKFVRHIRISSPNHINQKFLSTYIEQVVDGQSDY